MEVPVTKKEANVFCTALVDRITIPDNPLISGKTLEELNFQLKMGKRALLIEYRQSKEIEQHMFEYPWLYKIVEDRIIDCKCGKDSILLPGCYVYMLPGGKVEHMLLKDLFNSPKTCKQVFMGFELVPLPTFPSIPKYSYGKSSSATIPAANLRRNAEVNICGLLSRKDYIYAGQNDERGMTSDHSRLVQWNPRASHTVENGDFAVFATIPIDAYGRMPDEGEDENQTIIFSTNYLSITSGEIQEKLTVEFLEHKIQDARSFPNVVVDALICLFTQ